MTWALVGVNLDGAHARRGCAMTFSFEELLVEVYKQLFSDNARLVKIGTPDIQFNAVTKVICDKWTSYLTDMTCAGLSRIPVQITAGQHLFALGKKLRSLLATDVTLRAWLTAS